MKRRGYPSDSKDEEWAFVAPYLSLISETAPQRKYELREVFDALKWMVKTGSPWRYLPSDVPPWEAVYQQSRRWLEAGVFEAMAHDLRSILRLAQARQANPSAVVLDGRTLRSSPESGYRAGFDGHKKIRGSKVHAAVDTLGMLLAVVVTPANEQERAQVANLSKQIQEVTQESVKIAFADQGYTGEIAKVEAAAAGIELVVVKHEKAKRGFVLLPKRWVVERSFAWISRFRRLAKDFERLPEVLAGLHFVAFTCLLLNRFRPLLALPVSS
jgi:transposase